MDLETGGALPDAALVEAGAQLRVLREVALDGEVEPGAQRGTSLVAAALLDVDHRSGGVVDPYGALVVADAVGTPLAPCDVGLPDVQALAVDLAADVAVRRQRATGGGRAGGGGDPEDDGAGHAEHGEQGQEVPGEFHPGSFV